MVGEPSGLDQGPKEMRVGRTGLLTNRVSVTDFVNPGLLDTYSNFKKCKSELFQSSACLHLGLTIGVALIKQSLRETSSAPENRKRHRRRKLAAGRRRTSSRGSTRSSSCAEQTRSLRSSCPRRVSGGSEIVSPVKSNTDLAASAEYTVFIVPTELELDVYERIVQGDAVQTLVTSGAHGASALSVMTVLRKLCNTPGLLMQDTKKVSPTASSCESPGPGSLRFSSLWRRT
jgi:SNF2 family DNA or RNA helicase